jgi:hypothetical protein
MLKVGSLTHIFLNVVVV